MKTTEQHSNVVVRYVFLTLGAITFALGTAAVSYTHLDVYKRQYCFSTRLV